MLSFEWWEIQSWLVLPHLSKWQSSQLSVEIGDILRSCQMRKGQNAFFNQQSVNLSSGRCSLMEFHTHTSASETTPDSLEDASWVHFFCPTACRWDRETVIWHTHAVREGQSHHSFYNIGCASICSSRHCWCLSPPRNPFSRSWCWVHWWVVQRKGGGRRAEVAAEMESTHQGSTDPKASLCMRESNRRRNVFVCRPKTSVWVFFSANIWTMVWLHVLTFLLLIVACLCMVDWEPASQGDYLALGRAKSTPSHLGLSQQYAVNITCLGHWAQDVELEVHCLSMSVPP